MMSDNKIAIIPLRAGSKGIKNKNKKKILGRPLFSWVLCEAIQSELDKIYIFTDDLEIQDYVNKEYSWSEKVFVIERSVDSASDTASTELGMIELAEKLNFNFTHYFLLQATSPLTSSKDINKAISILNDDDTDSVLSVVKTHRFIWKSDGTPLNYDYLKRPRRQDFDGLLIENGAIYGCKKNTFIQSKNRLGGNIKTFEMSEDTLTEIDEPSDLIIIEQLLKTRLSGTNKLPKPIKYAVFDVDGVFTNATVNYTENGEFSKTFSFIDGMGLEILRNNNIEPVIMTSENSFLVQKRMEKLKIQYIFLGIKDKYARLSQFLKDNRICWNEVAYLGDDINDLTNIISCGWGVCPGNAVKDVSSQADFQLNSTGGNGAIREFVEFLIKYNTRF